MCLHSDSIHVHITVRYQAFDLREKGIALFVRAEYRDRKELSFDLGFDDLPDPRQRSNRARQVLAALSVVRHVDEGLQQSKSGLVDLQPSTNRWRILPGRGFTGPDRRALQWGLSTSPSDHGVGGREGKSEAELLVNERLKSFVAAIGRAVELRSDVGEPSETPGHTSRLRGSRGSGSNHVET